MRVTNNGLQIAIDPAGGGNVTIKEVGGGTTAASLGILTLNGNGTTPIVGSDLDPRATRTTSRLDDILGTRASAVVSSNGTNNDLLL